jgi:hypothetical protein
MLRHKPKLGRRTHLHPDSKDMWVIRHNNHYYSLEHNIEVLGYEGTRHIPITQELYEAFVNESRRNSRNNVAVS